MADRILDDDDIIDLTDLLEEGEPKKKEKEKKVWSPARANEPDSFDLGKEISMEYEVSVEEIEQGSDGIDIDASLSSNEEVALTREREGGEGAPASAETEEVLFDDNRERGTGKTDLSEGGLDALSQEKKDVAGTCPETDIEDHLDAVPEKAVDKIPEEPASEIAPTAEDAAGLDAREPVMEELKDTSSALQAGEGLPSESVRNLAHTLVTEDVLTELRQEVPAMIEGIVRPLVSELVKEMVAATREQLPGIVEKVIREEIEKLKKLDS
ncbi:MAG TPA: hypothetical protein PLA83_08750 [Deltaproteobacteria bacterium]|nr:hypothetical protein [Deltaproteobacteria bacterium]HQI00474.1 hypothetical protein [Deltaproteobacteria bacterium]HQJ07365.1 hypothetical protein [Deltaproteobacteria bacterium]